MIAAKAVVEKEIRICIKNACPACYSGDKPKRDPDGRWWHEEYDEVDDRDENRECDASDLNEAMRRIRAALRDGKGKPRKAQR